MEMNQQPIDDELGHEDLESLGQDLLRRNVTRTPKPSGNPLTNGSAGDAVGDEQNMYGNDAVSPNLGAELDDNGDLDLLSNLEDLDEDPGLLRDEGSTLDEDLLSDDDEVGSGEGQTAFDPEALDSDNWGTTDQTRHLGKPMPSESELDRESGKGRRRKDET